MQSLNGPNCTTVKQLGRGCLVEYAERGGFLVEHTIKCAHQQRRQSPRLTMTSPALQHKVLGLFPRSLIHPTMEDISRMLSYYLAELRSNTMCNIEWNLDCGEKSYQRAEGSSDSFGKIHIFKPYVSNNYSVTKCSPGAHDCIT